MTTIKVSDALMDMLNSAIAREMQVSIQYIWQHVLWTGVKGLEVKDVFKKFAIVEMKHAETIAERLALMGGTPTVKPSPIFVGKTLKEMIEQDRSDEEGAIKLYRDIIAKARQEGDESTTILFQRILSDEEEHHNTFESLLEDL
jgi:bacterioferritin